MYRELMERVSNMFSKHIYFQLIQFVQTKTLLLTKTGAFMCSFEFWKKKKF